MSIALQAHVRYKAVSADDIMDRLQEVDVDPMVKTAIVKAMLVFLDRQQEQEPGQQQQEPGLQQQEGQQLPHTSSESVQFLALLLNSRISDLRDNVNQRIDDLRDYVNKRFDEVDKQFDKIDKRFDEIDKRFDEMDKRFDEIDKVLGRR